MKVYGFWYPFFALRATMGQVAGQTGSTVQRFPPLPSNRLRAPGAQDGFIHLLPDWQQILSQKQTTDFFSHSAARLCNRFGIRLL
jgi:hypothetical protein